MEKTLLFLVALVAINYTEKAGTTEIFLCTLIVILMIGVISSALIDIVTIRDRYKDYKECFKLYNEATTNVEKEHYRHLINRKHKEASSVWLPPKIKKDFEDIHACIQKV